MKRAKRATTRLTEFVIDLNKFTPAERKMFDLGGYIAVKKYAPEPIRKQGDIIQYFYCSFQRISDNDISVKPEAIYNMNIEFNLQTKTFKTTFSRLDYNMLCAVMERCRELGWDKGLKPHII